MLKKSIFLLLFSLTITQSYISNACTNFIITRGASTDGSNMITYAADSHTLYGELYFHPSADYPEGTMLDIYEWDTGKYLGQIEQVAHTYQVVGNINEHQLAIGETTFGGREELHTQSDAIIDYGSLMYITLQRAKTAREAIKVMTDLVEKYGYYSSGESFSISDPDEVWILEMIGKGEGEKGAVWVALKVPDGYISGHANQARITQFPTDAPANCIYSRDVISFSREKGWFDGRNSDFSFSDTYAPVDFGGARFCESRVWSGFNKVNSQMAPFLDYAMGDIIKDKNGYASNRMPLWIKPDTLISLQDVFGMMRDHFEGTPLDMTNDIGAGPHKLPYRWRGLTWQVDSVNYCNERAISTQQTGFSFVAQSRPGFPDPIGGILWFGVDDTYSTCYMPIYCGITEIPESLKTGNGDMLTWSDNSAFWLFNLVTNLCYLRYDDMIKDLQIVQNELETKFIEYNLAVDQAAITLWYSGKRELAKQFITEYSANQADLTFKEWKRLSHYLMVKYKDGNIMKEKNGRFERNEHGKLPASPNQPGYPDWWYRKIIKNTGDHFKMN
jgi:dipeptidase